MPVIDKKFLFHVGNPLLKIHIVKADRKEILSVVEEISTFQKHMR
jgi:hypothetical protein